MRTCMSSVCSVQGLSKRRVEILRGAEDKGEARKASRGKEEIDLRSKRSIATLMTLSVRSSQSRAYVRVAVSSVWDDPP